MVGSSFVLTSGEVRRRIGVSQRQLTHWDETDLVFPSGRLAEGSGSRRLYTLRDLIKLKVIVRLRGAGIPLQRVRRAFDVLDQLPDEPAPLAELEILTDGRRIIVVRSDESLLDPVASQYVLKLSLVELVEELDVKESQDSPAAQVRAKSYKNGRNPQGILR